MKRRVKLVEMARPVSKKEFLANYLASLPTFNGNQGLTPPANDGYRILNGILDEVILISSLLFSIVF